MDNLKFKLLEEVYFEGTRYWVTGIDLKHGYDFCAWQYTVSKTLYSDASPLARGDKTSKGWLREEQLLSIEEEMARREKEILDLVEAKKKELAELEARKEKLKRSASTCTAPASEAS